ncbi:winged helix-turn-helix transcriptional regulator [Candidatus Bipolaricaulota bacterium]|nr:winged helix-turn-helix transcriptional regulator [Candidatus Bipolaricaulota bacterium]
MAERDDHLREWSDKFASLASEPRLRIVDLLSNGKLHCQEVIGKMELSQPAVSYHLGKLERAGLLIKQRNGATNCYQLSETAQALVRLMEKEGFSR